MLLFCLLFLQVRDEGRVDSKPRISFAFFSPRCSSYRCSNFSIVLHNTRVFHSLQHGFLVFRRELQKSMRHSVNGSYAARRRRMLFLLAHDDCHARPYQVCKRQHRTAPFQHGFVVRIELKNRHITLQTSNGRCSHGKTTSIPL